MVRGHKTEKSNGNTVYSDTKELVSKNWKTRPCGKCNKEFTKEGHDPCIGTLKGTMNACCGHGHDEPYIQFLDGHCVRGENAEILFKILR